MEKMMMTEADTANTEPIPPRRTDATTRETRLVRLDALDLYLSGEFGADPSTKRIWAADLRWLILRERARNLLPILEPVDEKPFVLTDD
jgi:hypothetical protein